ncbi:DUF3606 domain-containing protein [Mesorhizobium sp.]|uniref:DUF3606 domain-containing protein n=1 Tax=Mesorhizobium sp. TaxID=1871066 RepID=UPI000FEA9FF8|nr:DUF3606 domain-containing protein [Mesorhizobium sp.]RWQ16787.1 MAG: DUF3606 domain-containing protein [Mesorhizobium sp.]
MADDKTKRDFRDRNLVAVDEDYEVEHFARENGITPEQLIKATGNDRGALTAAAKQLKTVLQGGPLTG